MIRSNKGDTGKDGKDLEKSTSHVISKIIEYLPRSVISKTVLKKITGNITVSCLDAGQEMEEKSLPFDIYVQIIDGAAEILIDKQVYQMVLGEGIIIPAHSTHHFNANEQFKMISTVIKSGYED
ncbi:cupin domain-containing protein [Cyclobacterium roseum]|uniref:cupin domain-containing protein n=1 Tax=Cyclobacterium roseum TaxID=2666137 RepID=UPI001391AD13|nr:cupin domain-containing protein [Cyclobacterium roseum]